MTGEDKAVGFAAQFSNLGDEEAPPDLPRIKLLQKNKESQETAEASLPRSRQPGRPSQSPKSPGKRRKSVGLQLRSEHILFIGTYAEKHRLFKQIAFDRLCTLALDDLGDITSISIPGREGPDDYAYFPQKTMRILPEILDRIDAAAKRYGVNRSQLVRYLLDQFI